MDDSLYIIFTEGHWKKTMSETPYTGYLTMSELDPEASIQLDAQLLQHGFDITKHGIRRVRTMSDQFAEWPEFNVYGGKYVLECQTCRLMETHSPGECECFLYVGGGWLKVYMKI